MHVVACIPNPEVRGVGIVFDNGRPVISQGWLESLSDSEMESVVRVLEARGFRLLNGSIIEAMDNGNP